MTLSATLTSDKIAKGISEGEAGVLMHGPTFMGNPLACAAACASIDLLLEQNWQQRVADINDQLQQLHQCMELKDVADVRTLGAIGVVELSDEVGSIDVATIQAYFVEKGVWIRPFGKLIYLMPPYISDENSIKTLCNAIYSAIKGKHYAKAC